MTSENVKISNRISRWLSMSYVVLRRPARLWQRIKSTRMPGMAATHTLRRKPSPLRCTIPVQRFDRVFGAGGKKPASSSKQWADRIAIGPYRASKQPLHPVSLASNAATSRCSAGRSSAATGRTSRNTTSQLGNDNQARRNASRARRFTRLRVTARRASFRATTNPSRAPRPLFGR